jgi:hypothetical protein
LFSDLLLLKGTPRVVSDELVNVLTQADCPLVVVIFTAVLLPPASRQLRIEEFPASSGVFVTIIRSIFTLDLIMGSNSIPENILFSPTVHPVPAPFSTRALTNNKISEGGNNQKLILFNLGKLISTAPICTGNK